MRVLHQNSQLLTELAMLIERCKHELAEANSEDVRTNFGVNADNVERGIATLRSYASMHFDTKRLPRGGIAIYSCYGDPSLVTLGMSLAPALLANGSQLPIYLYFPSLLKAYKEVFLQMISKNENFRNIHIIDSSKAFFDKAINDPIVDTCLVYGDEWIDEYLVPLRENKKNLLFFGPGNNTAVITDNDNMQARANEIATMACILSGQAAVCIKRVVLSDTVNASEFTNMLKSAMMMQKKGLNPHSDFVTPILYHSLVSHAGHMIEHAVNNGAEAWSFSAIDTVFGTLVTPSLIIEPDLNSQLWKNYHFIPALSLIKCHHHDIAHVVNLNNYKLAVSIYGKRNAYHKLKNSFSQQHAFVFHNSNFLDIMTTNKGYTGYWGGFGKSAFWYSYENNYTPVQGMFNIYEVFTKTR